MEIGSVTVGVPLVNKQNTYSTNLFLVKMSHEEGDIVKIDQKVCEIELINFNDDDQPFSDLAWMVIPHLYSVTGNQPASSLDKRNAVV